MRRIIALAAVVLCLAGCFVFDNPFENSSTPTATFQIVVHSAYYGGTYVWNSPDNAYEAVVRGSRYYIYMDAAGYWCVLYLLNQNHTTASHWSSSPLFGAMPATTSSSWSPSGEIMSVDDSAGGVSMSGYPPDSLATSGNTLRVAFKASDSGNSATYQWERSSSPAFTSPVLIGTGSTYFAISGDATNWIRVRVTPTDSTGTITGSPVVSPPVYIGS